MAPWMIMGLALAVFYVIGFVVTWAIREGGSYEFLIPNRWRKNGRPPRSEAERKE